MYSVKINNLKLSRSELRNKYSKLKKENQKEYYTNLKNLLIEYSIHFEEDDNPIKILRNYFLSLKKEKLERKEKKDERSEEQSDTSGQSETSGQSDTSGQSETSGQSDTSDQEKLENEVGLLDNLKIIE